MPESPPISAEQWDSWPDDKLLTPEQVGFVLSYSAKTVKGLICRKAIPCVQEAGGRAVRVRLGDLKHYITRHTGRYKPPSTKGQP